MEDSRIGCLVTGSPRSGTTLCAAMIGAHPDVGMLSEDLGHGAEAILGVKVWGNKLCIPNQITLDPRTDNRSVWKRLEDGVRAVLGRPRRLPREHESYPTPPDRQHTIRTYVEKGARIIAMLRPPDHVVDSIRRRGSVSVEEGKYRWSRAIRAIYRANDEFGDRTCLVRFTDLVCEPEAVTQRLCLHLDLRFSKKMVEGYRYTPQYDRDRLDPSAATRDVESYDLDAFDPEAVEMYNRLDEKAAQGLRSAPIPQ
jgi:hypothetical protein